MIPIDLITGFLGAGKTTFLLRYAKYLVGRGLKVGILAYDRGAVNVDMPLLQELRALGCGLEMLAGACDADCHRRRFRTKLIAMGMSGYDRVLIEPSGVFDMDEFFDTLNEAPLDRWYEAGGVIAVVDAKLEENTAPEEDFFLASQAAGAGCVVLSRVQLASPAEIERTVAHLHRAEEAIHSRLTPAASILVKDWDTLTEADFEKLTRCGYYPADYVKTTAEAAFQSLSFLNLTLNRAQLDEKVDRLLTERRFGKVLRVKGFFPADGRWYQFNATARDRLVEQVDSTRAALIVIGCGLDEDAINLLLTGKLPEHHIL
ncbi:MAG: GTP-binding protein [Oscillospiraceae bacterium]|nr:GTP-binding protein [Oscillospiraceae bacterium]